MKNRKPQRILAWDEDRAAFKKRVTELLEPLKQELGIVFEFGRIDEVDTKYGFEATAKMKCYFSKMKPANVITIDDVACDPYTFQPRIGVRKNGELWFSFGLELQQDIKFGPTFSGMQPLTDEEALRELIALYQYEYPGFNDEVIQAFDLMMKRAEQNKNPNPDGGGHIPPMSEQDIELWANEVLPKLRSANPTPIKVKFLGKNGYPYELNRAEEVFNTNDEYEIVGGVINSSSSYYEFKGIRGQWNTVMFSGHWEQAQHLMEHNYL